MESLIRPTGMKNVDKLLAELFNTTPVKDSAPGYGVSGTW
jgi:hypothetical protein